MIINKHQFEHSGHHSKKSLKISKHLYTNIFYRVSQQCIDINWTRDGIQFSVDNPYLVLLTVADIDTLSIENCEMKIRKVCISILVNFVVVPNMHEIFVTGMLNYQTSINQSILDEFDYYYQ